MQKPDNIGFFPNVILLTGLTLSGLIPMFFIGDGYFDPFRPTQPQEAQAQGQIPVAGNTPAFAANSMAVAATPQAASSQDLGALYQQIQTGDKKKATPGQKPALPMPVGFDGRWSTIALDGGKINLQVLRQAYTLPQTQNRAGAEYFDYASFLFTQVGQQVDDPALTAQFKRLSTEADAMARHMREASALRFDGPPNESMDHMTVRSDMLSHLGNLNSRGVSVVDLDEAGHEINSAAGRNDDKPEPGQSLNRFRKTLNGILADPGFRQNYPQTLRVVQLQAMALEALAMNLEMRWESVFDCHGSGCMTDQLASRMRIYAVQKARPRDAALATEAAIYQWLDYIPQHEV